MNDQAKSNPETDTMSPEEMARYLMGFAVAIWRQEMVAQVAHSISRPVTMAMENAVSVFLPTGTFEEEELSNE